MNQSESFGYCIIPKNTLLYRGHRSDEHQDYMYFALKRSMASTSTDRIQVWKTTKEIKVIFLVEYLTESAGAISSIPKLYSFLFSEESFDEYGDLSIKKNPERMNRFWRKLHYDHDILGWFTSIENNAELEVCLFDKIKNEDHVKLLAITELESEEYFKNSLRKIKIVPTQSFYDRSRQKIMELAPYGSSPEKMFREYLSRDNYCNKEDADGDKEFLAILKERRYDLRLKLKI